MLTPIYMGAHPKYMGCKLHPIFLHPMYLGCKLHPIYWGCNLYPIYMGCRFGRAQPPGCGPLLPASMPRYSCGAADHHMLTAAGCCLAPADCSCCDA